LQLKKEKAHIKYSTYFGCEASIPTDASKACVPTDASIGMQANEANVPMGAKRAFLRLRSQRSRGCNQAEQASKDSTVSMKAWAKIVKKWKSFLSPN
jgi:hypothetical protein